MTESFVKTVFLAARWTWRVYLLLMVVAWILWVLYWSFRAVSLVTKGVKLIV